MHSTRLRFLTIRQFADEHSWPTANSWYWMTKGHGDPALRCCLVRRGNRWLIDEQRFLEVMAAGEGGEAAEPAAGREAEAS